MWPTKLLRSRQIVLLMLLLAGISLAAHRADAQPAQAQTGGVFYDTDETDDEEDSKGPKLSVNIGAASDYRFRGFSQTDGNAAVQGGADFIYHWFYIGAWATNVDFGQELNDLGRFETLADYAIYSYGGVRQKFGGTELDGGFIYYTYPGSAGFADLDFYEFYGSVAQDFTKDLTGTVVVYYSPDYQGGVGRNWIVEGDLRQKLAKIGEFQPSVSGTLAYSDGQPSKGGFDYWYWNVGASLIFHDYFEFDLRFFDTFDVPGNVACSDICDGKVVARLTFEN